MQHEIDMGVYVAGIYRAVVQDAVPNMAIMWGLIIELRVRSSFRLGSPRKEMFSRWPRLYRTGFIYEGPMLKGII